MGIFNEIRNFFLIIVIFFSHHLHAKDTLEKMGDVGQYAIPLSAAAITIMKKDHEGLFQLVRASLITFGVTYSIKYSYPTTRPNGGNHSFPSGHTAGAFAGAAFLDRRYGLDYGCPAYAAAGFVGYTRIKSHAHYPIDVFGSIVIAYLTNYFLTTKWSCDDGIRFSWQKEF